MKTYSRLFLLFLAIAAIVFCTYGCKKEAAPDVCQTCIVSYKNQTTGAVTYDSTEVVLCNDERLNAINGSQTIFVDSLNQYVLKQTICK